MIFIFLDGKAYIVMPEKRSMRNNFEENLNSNGLKYDIIFFNDIKDNNENFYITILKDEKESKKAFEDIKKMNILYYLVYKE
jgi:hypothetical protein